MNNSGVVRITQDIVLHLPHFALCPHYLDKLLETYSPPVAHIQAVGERLFGGAGFGHCVVDGRI